MSYITGFLLLFLYISNIQLVFLPDKIRTRLIIGVIGAIYYMFKYLGKDTYRIKALVATIIPLALWMGFSIACNTDSQYWFLQYVLLQIVYMFGAAFVIDVSGIKAKDTLLLYVVGYVIIQDAIAFANLMTPSVSTILNYIQVDQFAEEKTFLKGFRAMAFGEFAVFGGGIWIAIGQLALTQLYKKNKIHLYLYIGLFAFLFVTGLFVARTSLTGLISLLLLLTPFKKNFGKVFAWILMAFMTLGFLQTQERMLESWGLQTNYAFEIFDNYRATGEFHSNSYEGTKEMWRTLPTDLKTWFIGDAKYVDDRIGGYYMHVDVGYLRVLFYGGLVGLFLYLAYIFKLCKTISIRSNKERDYNYFVWLYYAMVLIWMWKGHNDTNFFLFLLIFTSTIEYKQRIVGMKQLTKA